MTLFLNFISIFVACEASCSSVSPADVPAVSYLEAGIHSFPLLRNLIQEGANERGKQLGSGAGAISYLLPVRGC